MKKLLTLSAVAAAMLVTGGMMTGCCNGGGCPLFQKAESGEKIFNVKWELEEESLVGSAKKWEKPERDITFQMDAKGKVSGCAGVNRYFGEAKVNPKTGSLKFSDKMGATRMAGKGMQFEDAYLKMLSTVDSYELRNGHLYFKAGKNVVAIFDN